MEAFPKLQPDQMSKLLKSTYKGSWQAMYLEQPHVRYDGVYVSRNTYLRTGIVEWRTKNPVHLVCYFRYLRFFADGQFLYRTSPEVVSKVAKLMINKPVGRLKPDDTLQTGIYRIMSSKVYTALVYANSFQTEVRTKLRLRSTCRGANNRLDVETMVSYDKNDGVSTPMMGQTPEDEEPEDPRQLLGQPNTRAHARGMEPYVFVPWDKVHNHVLNMDVKQMDFYVPG
jgi:F-box protein 9